MESIVYERTIEEELLELKQQRNDLDAKMNVLSEEINTFNKTRKELASSLDSLKGKISNLEKPIVITDHALMRYLERVIGLDMELYRKQVLTDSVKRQILKRGDGHYSVTDYNGFEYYVVYKEGAVVSITPGRAKE